MSNDFRNIITIVGLVFFISIILYSLAYPITLLIGKAWHKSYLEQISNNLEDEENE